MINNIQLRKLHHRCYYDRRFRYTKQAFEAYHRARVDAFKTVPICRVELVRLEYDIVIRMLLQDDIEVECSWPEFGWMLPGGFLIHSDVIGKTIDETWARYGSLEMPSFNELTDYELEYGRYEELIASRDAEGIALHKTDCRGEQTKEISEWWRTTLSYVHPDGIWAVKEFWKSQGTQIPPLSVKCGPFVWRPTI